MPDQVVKRYGEPVGTWVADDWLGLSTGYTNRIVRALTAFGYRCLRDDNAIDRYSHI